MSKEEGLKVQEIVERGVEQIMEEESIGEVRTVRLEMGVVPVYQYIHDN